MTQRQARRTRAQWADIIAQFQRSGLDARAFCEKEQITLVTFNKWRLRHSQPSPPLSHAEAPAFTSVTHIEPTAKTVSSVSLQIGALITVSISVDGSVDGQ